MEMKLKIRKENRNIFIAFIILIIADIIFLTSVFVIGFRNYYGEVKPRDIRTSVFTTELITVDTSLDSDNVLTLTMNELEEIKVGSSPNIEIGPLTHEYMFTSRGGATNNISLNFQYKTYSFDHVHYDLTLCDESGNITTHISDDKYIDEFQYFKYTSTSDIYVKEVKVTYEVYYS